jgi:macrolide-specific efflux system membrane fusion protein
MEIWFSTLADQGRRWPATLRQINPAGRVNRGAVEFIALLDVDNSDLRLYPNMTVQVFFVTARADNVLAVPTRALTFTEASDGSRQARVTVVQPDDSTVTRTITIGTMDRINAEVLSGLEAGDRVVVGTS